MVTGITALSFSKREACAVARRQCAVVVAAGNVIVVSLLHLPAWLRIIIFFEQGKFVDLRKDIWKGKATVISLANQTKRYTKQSKMNRYYTGIVLYRKSTCCC